MLGTSRALQTFPLRTEVLVYQLACLSLTAAFRNLMWLVLKRGYEQLRSLGADPLQLAATQVFGRLVHTPVASEKRNMDIKFAC
jgi:hypothetical protein